MRALDLRNPGLLEIFQLSLRRTYAYRAFAFLGVLQVLLQLVLLRAVWRAVYDDRATLDGVSIETTVTYLTIVGLLSFMMHPGIAREIHRRIDQGMVAVDLVRPVGFVRQMLAVEMGDAIGRWMWLIIVVPGLVVIGSLAPPTAVVLLGFLTSVLLAFVVCVLIWLLVGLSGFWLIDVGGVSSVVGLIGGFLAGSTIPLWFMPEPLRMIVELLPFQAISFLPASIYVEQAQGQAIWRALGIQAFWAGALWVVAAWTWSRAQRRLVVQGG